jgi:hypothetical protein
MRHGSHGDAWFRRFGDYRKRKGTKQPGKTGCWCPRTWSIMSIPSFFAFRMIATRSTTGF